MNKTAAELEKHLCNAAGPAVPRLAVVSRSLLVREALVRRLSPLGVRVAAASRFDTLVREIEGGAPDLVLIDGDGWERPWNELVGELDLRRRGVQGLLLVSSMSVGQALGPFVAGRIVAMSGSYAYAFLAAAAAAAVGLISALLLKMKIARD